ncbi:terpene synthase family protein [Streptomyces sp. NPDC046261]|uniref:terpene synthase family protein n=1 Tax=Streptomyces sp. NPDC046261 TaxID=3157200 RepID=UPI0033DC0488
MQTLANHMWTSDLMDATYTFYALSSRVEGIDKFRQQLSAALQGLPPAPFEASDAPAVPDAPDVAMVRSAFQGTLEPVLALMPEGLRERYIAINERTLAAGVEEVKAEAQGRVLDVESYLRLRPVAVYGYWMGAHTEFTLGIDLTEDLSTHPELASLVDNVALSLALVNDLFSFRKEYYEGEMLSCVWVFHVKEGLSLQGAVDKTCDLINQNESEFIAKRDRILAGELGKRGDIRAYLAGLGYSMSGNLHYHRSCPRYHGLDHDWSTQIVSGLVTLDRDRTTVDPAARR